MAINQQIETLIQELEETQDATILLEWFHVLTDIFSDHPDANNGDGADHLFGIINPHTGTLQDLWYCERCPPPPGSKGDRVWYGSPIMRDNAVVLATRMLRRHLAIESANADEPTSALAEVNTSPSSDRWTTAAEPDKDPFIPTKREAEMLGILRNEGTMSLAGLVEFMHRSDRTVQAAGKALEDAGLIARKAGQYALTPKGRNFSL